VTEVEMVQCVIGLLGPISLQLCSIVIATCTRSFHQRGNTFMHDISNSKKMIVFCKGNSPRRPCNADDAVEAVCRS
jgi:hypothetical protein